MVNLSVKYVPHQVFSFVFEVVQCTLYNFVVICTHYIQNGHYLVIVKATEQVSSLGGVYTTPRSLISENLPWSLFQPQ